jgi:hypothetical protein
LRLNKAISRLCHGKRPIGTISDPDERQGQPTDRRQDLSSALRKLAVSNLLSVERP